MIECPNCGTSNPTGSRFCSACGEPLPSSGVRCPMCDTVNPAGSVYCQSCNARLVPMSEAPEDEALDAHDAAPDGGPDALGEERSPDWLAELREAAEDETDVVGEEGPEADEESFVRADLPEWLSEMGPVDEEPAQEAPDDEGVTVEEEGPEADEEPIVPPDIPEWLSEMGPVDEGRPREVRKEQADAPEEEVPEEGEEPYVPPDIPDWLSEMGPVDEGPPTEVARPDAEAGEEAISGDVARSRGEPTTVSDEEPVEPFLPDTTGPADESLRLEPADIPDWIRELRPKSDQYGRPPDSEEAGLDEVEDEKKDAWRRASEEPQPAEPDLSEAPYWLQDIPETGADEETGKGEPDDEESVLIEIPDWLREGEAGPSKQVPEAQEEVEPRTAEEAGEAQVEPADEAEAETRAELVEVPGWLQDTEDRMGGPPSEESMQLPPERPGERVETPNWLAELLSPEPLGEEDLPLFAEELPGGEADLEGDLEPAEIPGWLEELRPGGTEQGEAMRGPLESQGLLEGLRGLIPASPIPLAAAALEGLEAAAPDKATLAKAELLQGLLGPPTPKLRQQGREKEARLAGQVERWVVAVVLITVVLATLVRPLVAGPGPRLTQPVADSEASDVHDVVSALEAGDTVLTVFDYGVPEAAEVNTAAEPVIRHVLEEGAALSIVSTRPDGPLVAEAMLQEVDAVDGQFTLVGYRPGAALAASNLLDATDEDPSLLLILSGQPMPLLLWIEQATARYGGRVPVVLVGSAAVQPIASPYLDARAGQLSGGVYGFQGGSSYEGLRETSGSAALKLDALAAGHLAIILMMIVGALASAVWGRREDRG